MKEHLNPPLMDWQYMEKLILDSLTCGIAEKNLPETFYVSNHLWTIYESMEQLLTPEENLERKEQWRRGEFAGTEIAKAYSLEPDGSVEIIDLSSKSERTPFGIQMTFRTFPGMFGVIHNHPIHAPASNQDLVMLMAQKNLIETIVTPLKIITILRTDDLVADFNGSMMEAKAYLLRMGKKKGKLRSAKNPNDHVDWAIVAEAFRSHETWSVDDASLAELGLVRYEADRHSQRLLFERKV